LNEYDVKGQATVNFEVGTSKISAKDQIELKELANTATRYHRGDGLCGLDRQRFDEHETKRETALKPSSLISYKKVRCRCGISWRRVPWANTEQRHPMRLKPDGPRTVESRSKSWSTRVSTVSKRYPCSSGSRTKWTNYRCRYHSSFAALRAVCAQCCCSCCR
jgi:hypothetical protein